MLHFEKQIPATIDTEAVLFEVDCVGRFLTHPAPQTLIRPEVLAAYKSAFDLGQIEPGNPLTIAGAPSSTGQRYTFLLPTRVHWKGKCRASTLDNGMEKVLEQLLRAGIKSLAIPKLPTDDEAHWPLFKQRLLACFSRVPDIKIVVLPSVEAIDALKQVTLFTDGGAEPNPGVGGFGVVLRFGNSVKEISVGYELTSNNRMELMAAIAGLEALREPCQVRLHSDSRYVVDVVNRGFLFRLAENGWKNRKAKNIDLWKRFLAAYSKHDVEMVWVKGHAGVLDNERCDWLANQAKKQETLTVDDGYLDQCAKKSKVTQPLLLQIKKDGSAPHVASKLPNSKNGSGLPASGDASERKGPKPKKAGDPCRYCQKPLEQREAKKHKAGAAYWYAWYLYCTTCRRMYHVDAAKVFNQ